MLNIGKWVIVSTKTLSIVYNKLICQGAAYATQGSIYAGQGVYGAGQGVYGAGQGVYGAY